MRVEFEIIGREMIEAYQFVAKHGRDRDRLIAFLRRRNMWCASGCFLAAVVIILGWAIYLDRTGPQQRELITQPSPSWLRWALGASSIAAMVLFFGAVRCFEKCRRPGLAIREFTLGLAREDGWENLSEWCALEVGERGLTWEDPEKSTTYKHSKVHGIDRSDRFVFVYINPDIMYPVPIRINDTTRIDELIKMMEEYSGVEARKIPD